VSAGLVFTAAAANAQVSAPYESGRSPYNGRSDVGGPYAGCAEPRALRSRTDLDAGDRGLHRPPRERFLPLGIPRQRGFVYTFP